MLDKDLLKSDSSSDEKTYYANERVRRRFKRRETHSTDVPELARIVTRVAKARPALPTLATHKTPLFRTQSDAIFDAISRENFELRRENEELKRRVQERKERAQEDQSVVQVQASAPSSAPSSASAVAPAAQPEWVPAFFEALTHFLRENQAPKEPESEPEREQEPEGVEDPAKEIITVVKQLQSTLKELASAAKLGNDYRGDEALRVDDNPADSGSGSAADPAFYTPPSSSETHSTSATSRSTDTLAPEIVEALKELKVAVTRPVSVTLEPSKALAEMFAHEMAQEVPALSSSSSTIEHDQEQDQDHDQDQDHKQQPVSDDARRFLEQLRESDPKQYQQVLENIQRKVSDGDSTQFQEFVHDRLGLA